jgi:hypothetical protein
MIDVNTVTDIGHGILHYNGNDQSQLDSLRCYSRFLNVLWLPCSLNELSPEQILITNRFRERMFHTDGQFEHAELTRQVFANILTAACPTSVIELGCGKRPLLPAPSTAYFGFDIDPDAIEVCRSRGLFTMPVEYLYTPKIDIVNIDIVFGIFMFHFHINEALWGTLSSSLSENGFMIFNSIVDSGIQYSKKLADISQYGLVVNVIKKDVFSSREFMFVISKPNEYLDININLIRNAIG